jgi:hypothetical protein
MPWIENPTALTYLIGLTGLQLRRLHVFLPRGGLGSRLILTMGCLSSLLAGCSTQQTYQAGQTWQRNECQKMIDAQARGRCLESASAPYDAYKGQLEKDAKTN